MLIFSSDDNYSKNLMFEFADTLIKVDNLFIRKIENFYIEVDCDIYDVLEIEKMQSISKTKPKTVKIYPDFSMPDTFFTLSVISFLEFDTESKNFKIYCANKCNFEKNGNIVNDFNDNFLSFTKFFDLTKDEKNLVDLYFDKQYKPHFFNDQNIFVENEYKRIEKIIDKKKKRNLPDMNVKCSAGASDPFFELEKCTGLEKVKHEVKRLEAVLEYRKQSGNASKDSLHMCFYGNPGTGKTTIARIMAGILFNMGFITENKCVEINGLELKGGNVGQTSVITKSIIDFAKGGVLFIDEAYTLFDKSKNNFGIEAINVLLKEMEDNRENFVVILAGYYGPMQRLLDSNVGFRSRIKHYFDFEDYSAAELFEIFMNMLRNRHLYIEKDAMEEIIIQFKNAKTKKGFGNGRYVENFLLSLEEEHILNVSKEISKTDIISKQDIVKAGDIFEV